MFLSLTRVFQAISGIQIAALPNVEWLILSLSYGEIYTKSQLLEEEFPFCQVMTSYYLFITILHYPSNHSFIYYLLLYSIIRIEKFYTQLKVTSVACFIIVLPAWVFRYLTLAPAAASCYTFPIYSPEPTNYWTRLVAALYHSQPHFLSKITLFIKNIPHPIIYL